MDLNGDDPLTIMVYDCGGQQDYAMGQAPFLTGSSLFLLVVPEDKAEDQYYEDVVLRFLELLQARAPGAVIQLILSKTDLESVLETIESMGKISKPFVTEKNDIIIKWKGGK